MVTVGIIGGGVSGLAAAYYLGQASKAVEKIVILEGSKRLGGWIHSRQSEDGAIFEFGPRTIRPYGEPGLNTLQLVEDLGLQHRLLHVPKTHPAAKKRFVQVDGKLHALPSGMKAMSPVASPPFSESMVKILIREALSKYPDVEDESVHVFMTKHFGEDLANYVMNPLCRGIFAGDSRQLSMRSCFAAPFNLAKEHGSVVRGMMGAVRKKRSSHKEDLSPQSRVKDRVKGTAVWTLKAGLQELTDALAKKLLQDPRVEIHCNSMVSSICSPNSDRVCLNISNPSNMAPSSIEVDHVISSIYARDLSRALRLNPDSGESTQLLADHLARIPAVNVCVVNLEYMGDVLPFSGFGYLVPSFESEALLGCVFDSCTMPYHNARSGKTTTRLTVMIGGAWYESHFGSVDASPPLSKIEQMAIDAVRNQLGVQVEPSRTHVTLQRNCIPQYLVGHHALLTNIEAALASSSLPLSLVGSSYKGVSVNDCILNAKIEAEKLAKFLSVEIEQRCDDDFAENIALKL